MQFGGPGQVLRAMRRVQFHACPLQFLLDMRSALHRRLLRLPDFLQIGILDFLLGNLVFQVFESLFRCFVGFLFQCFALNFQMDQAPFPAIQFFGLGIYFHADERGRLIDQVDRLVR